MNDLDDGLQEGNGGGNGRFLSIKNGRFLERVPEGTEGATPRVLKMGVNAGKTVFEKSYTVLTGKIEGMYVKEPRTVDFGDGPRDLEESVIVMRVADGVVHIDLGHEGKAFSAFAKSLPNIDRNRKVRLSPYDYTKDGKRKVGMGITQAPTPDQKANPATVYEKDGTVKVPWFWNDKNKGDLPDPVEFFNPKSKKTEFLWEAHDNFLRLYLRTYGDMMKDKKEGVAQGQQSQVRPAENQAEVYGGGAASVVDNDSFDGGAHMEDEDLPFG